MDPSFDALASLVSDRVAQSLRENPVVLPEYLTLKQVAHLCGLSISSLERLIRMGKGPSATRFTDRAIRYHIDDVRSWARERGQ